MPRSGQFEPPESAAGFAPLSLATTSSVFASIDGRALSAAMSAAADSSSRHVCAAKVRRIGLGMALSSLAYFSYTAAGASIGSCTSGIA